jgi:hypothetical protein
MNKIAFLVLSCDKYSDLWQPFHNLFNLFWQDCPFDKYFASNNKAFTYSGFEAILMKDNTWSKGLYDSLTVLEAKYDYVLITLEDLFLIQKVDTHKLIETINSFLQNDGNYLRLFIKHKPHTSFNKYFGILEKNTPYRQNCVYSLWKIKTLKEIINVNENAWEFEKKGVNRCYNYDGFYSSNINHFIISNTVVKGKWMKSELNKIKSIIPEIIINRPIMNRKEAAILKLQTLYFNIFFKYVPWKQQNKLLSVIRDIINKFKTDD